MPDEGTTSGDPLKCPRVRDLTAVADDILKMRSIDKVSGTHHEKMEALNFLRRLGVLAEVKR